MIDLHSISLDDPNAFAILNDGKFSGVFQWGPTLQGLTRQFTVTSFDDMVAITSLARPGPMDAGASEKWVRRKTRKEKITYLHPLFESILSSTYGVVVYQEQVMRIAREIGDLPWVKVNALRRAMGKSQGASAFDVYGFSWKTAAIKKGLDENTANKAWDELLTFGRYGFNKSHAVAYSIISYQCCWLKHYYPFEFAAATLDSETEPTKQLTLLRELYAEGIDYDPVDIEHSTDRWQPIVRDGRRLLVGPLTAIKGLGPAGLIEINEARKNGSPLSRSLTEKLANAETEIDTLFPIAEAVKRLCPDFKAAKIVSEPTPIAEAKSGTEVMLVGVLKKVEQINENTPDRVKRRGREVQPKDALNIFIQDDTGEIFAKVHARSFDWLGTGILQKAKAGKSIYALKGSISNGDFRMLWINNARYIGEM